MILSDFQAIMHCRSCDSPQLVDILDLGDQPLANALVKDSNFQVSKYPLRTAFCSNCSLFQLKETIRKEILFDRYVWVTGTSMAAKEYSCVFFTRVLDRVKIGSKDLIVEIASNDGTFLKPFVSAGFSVLGVEPAKNIAQMAEKAGVRTLCAYWNRETAKTIVKSHGHTKVIIARNVIPHVSDLPEVMAGIYDALDENGMGIIEFHDGGIILKDLHYDSIYHEHLCYFTVKSMTKLLGRYGFYAFHIDPSPISGGSQVIYFLKKARTPDETYLHAAAVEDDSGCNDLTAWKEFAQRCFQHKAQTLELISEFKDKTIVGFGASARSSTYLNFCGLNVNQIKAIIDNNPLKQGFYAAGSNIPIISKEKGMALKPDLIFILAWNFKDEIMRECRNMGFQGQYLLPFPKTPRLAAREAV